MEKLNDARKPKHRLSKKGEDTRSRIDFAAAKLMFEKGISGTSVGMCKKRIKSARPSNTIISRRTEN